MSPTRLGMAGRVFVVYRDGLGVAMGGRFRWRLILLGMQGWSGRGRSLVLDVKSGFVYFVRGGMNELCARKCCCGWFP